jgi:primosomal replication protein N
MANSTLAKHLCNSGVNELKDFISHSEEEFTSNDCYIECTHVLPIVLLGTDSEAEFFSTKLWSTISSKNSMHLSISCLKHCTCILPHQEWA